MLTPYGMGVDEFAEIAAARARLDDRELDLIDQARRRGMTWAEIAVALGLASRQAAEQRRRRLAAGARSRRQEQDSRYGLSTLRAAVLALAAAIGADARWDGRFPRAALVRETVATAAEAGSGPLFALAAQAATDLVAAGRLPPAIRAAVVDLRLALRASVPAASTSR
jgi:hypothetical protein